MSQSPRTFFTADLHLGHRNIVELEKRPFADVDAMNEAIIERWNERVRDDDVVFVLGDFALGRIEETLELVPRLAGRKILVAGNHDRCFLGRPHSPTRLDHDGWAQRYVQAGFVEVYHRHVTLHVHTKLLGQVQVSHFPYADAVVHRDGRIDDRFSQYRPVHSGEKLLLHGHVHSAFALRTQPHPMINVGMDVWDFYPVSEEELDVFLDVAE